MIRPRRALLETALPLALIGLTFLLHRKAFGVFFATDDLLFLMRADGLEPWLDTYPLRRLLSVKWFFTAAWHLFGDRHQLYHLFILTVHGLGAWLTVLLARRLRLSGPAALVAGLLFLAAPVGFTCLNWISGVQDVLLAFFSLLTALCLTRAGRRWEAAALGCYVLAMLSKEAGFLLLPVLLWALPAPAGLPAERRRPRLARLLGIGVPAGLVILIGAGAFMERAPTDPYATKIGVNILQNLLTYTAWLARPWVAFPDFRPEYDPALWKWGLVLPAIWAAALWRRPAWRPAILKATAVFAALLLPVLPLVRHSYLYYLYVPLLPAYLLAAAGLQRLPARYSRLVWLAPALLLALNAWQGETRRAARLEGKLVADPMLRYAEMGKNAVADLRAADLTPAGDAIFLVPFLGENVDLAAGLRDAKPGARRMSFVPLWRGLRDGKALHLFFPELKSAKMALDLSDDADAARRWRRSRLYRIGGQGHVYPLGEGAMGRYALSRLFFQYGDLPRTRRELEVLLEEFPADPNLLSDMCVVSAKLGDAARIEEVLSRMRELAAEGDAPADFIAMLRDLEQKYGAPAAPAAPMD